MVISSGLPGAARSQIAVGLEDGLNDAVNSRLAVCEGVKLAVVKGVGVSFNAVSGVSVTRGGVALLAAGDFAASVALCRVASSDHGRLQAVRLNANSRLITKR